MENDEIKKLQNVKELKWEQYNAGEQPQKKKLTKTVLKKFVH